MKHWKSIIAIILVLGAMIFELYGLFGILYTSWAIYGIKSGHAYIIEDISKHEAPVLFWVINLIWLGSGLYMVAESAIYWYQYFLYY